MGRDPTYPVSSVRGPATRTAYIYTVTIALYFIALSSMSCHNPKGKVVFFQRFGIRFCVALFRQAGVVWRPVMILQLGAAVICMTCIVSRRQRKRSGPCDTAWFSTTTLAPTVRI